MTTEAGTTDRYRWGEYINVGTTDSPLYTDRHPCNENFKLDEFFNGSGVSKKLMGNISDRLRQRDKLGHFYSFKIIVLCKNVHQLILNWCRH